MIVDIFKIWLALALCLLLSQITVNAQQVVQNQTETEHKTENSYQGQKKTAPDPKAFQNLQTESAPLPAAKPLTTPPVSIQTTPHILELFTAEGCSGCPEANQLINAYANKKNVLLLLFSVEDWDYLGWVDKSAKPEFGARQASYRAKFHLKETSAPQIIIDGRYEFVGVDEAKIAPRLQGLRHTNFRVRALNPHRIKVSGDSQGQVFDVWLLTYDTREATTEITSGENKGKTVFKKNLVTYLVRLSRWRGGDKLITLPPDMPKMETGLKKVVILQKPHGGEIAGAYTLSF